MRTTRKVVALRKAAGDVKNDLGPASLGEVLLWVVSSVDGREEQRLWYEGSLE